MHLPNGSQIFLEAERQLQGQVTQISRGRDAVITVVGHSMVTGDIVVFQGGGMDGMFGKVQRYDTNRFIVRGTNNFVRSRSFDFVGSLCYKVTSWAEIPCVQDINIEGGEQQYYNYQCLSDDREQQMKTFKSAQSVTVTYAWEYSDSINSIARKADEDEVKRLCYMTIPRASEVRFWCGTVSFNAIVNTNVNEMETTSITFNLSLPQAQMPEVIPGSVPVEEVTVLIDTLIPGQLQVGEFATRRVSLYPSIATDTRVDWGLSNENVAVLTTGEIVGVRGLTPGMSEMYAISKGPGSARGATPFQVIPAIPATSATIVSNFGANRAQIGSDVRFNVASLVPSNSGEKLIIKSSNQGVGRLDYLSDDGRLARFQVVGASTFRAEVWSEARNVKIGELATWFYGFRDTVNVGTATTDINVNDTNWPSVDHYRNNLAFNHTSGVRRIVKFRPAPATSDFFLLSAVSTGSILIPAGVANNASDYLITPSKVVAIQATPNGWTLAALN